MLYRKSLGQEALYRVRQGFGVFLHNPLFGSSVHREEPEDVISKFTTIGGGGSGSSSHCNVTLWFSSTVFDGMTLNVMPAKMYKSIH